MIKKKVKKGGGRVTNSERKGTKRSEIREEKGRWWISENGGKARLKGHNRMEGGKEISGKRGKVQEVNIRKT